MKNIRTGSAKSCGKILSCSALILAFILSSNIYGQNTVGTTFYDTATQDGYTLYTIYKQTYLINNCGQIVNQWDSEYKPGNAVYLLENGDLLRAGNTESDFFQFGGNGGVVERYNWEGELQWQYFYDNDQHRQHHDIYPMPNGNVLILATTLVTKEEAIQLGRDPDKIAEDMIYNERIIEVEPSGSDGGTIVWEWNFIDHIIQDFDNTKDNFGSVKDNPQLVDFNYTLNEMGGARWLHINSMQYEESLDQIILSSRHLNEIYIIDHSTTTEEAATGSGGTYGKGGDFLFRWGNPQVYRQGTEADQQLDGQHFPYFIDEGLMDEGNLIVFNNFYTRSPSQSAVYILDLPETSPGFYSYQSNTAYGPEEPYFIYTEPDFFSGIVSSAQRLPNGNMLLLEGNQGEISEITSTGELVWKYYVPVDLNTGEVLSQGDNPNMVNSITFRATKFTPDYPAFIGRDLSPGDTVELNGNVSSCVTLSDEESNLVTFKIYPNPTSGVVEINTQANIESVELYSLNGNFLGKYNLPRIDISELSSGLYLLKIHSDKGVKVQRLVKI